MADFSSPREDARAVHKVEALVQVQPRAWSPDRVRRVSAKAGQAADIFLRVIVGMNVDSHDDLPFCGSELTQAIQEEA
jgi:hypothetical protein